MRRCLLLSGLWVLLAPAWVVAAAIERLQVERAQVYYRLDLEAHIAAPLPAVWDVLTDYAHLDRLTPAILESEVLDAKDHDLTRVRTLSRVCVWIFCRDLKHVQRMRTPQSGRLEAMSEPQLSDFSAGRFHWQLAADGTGTRLDMWAEIVPAFWVPPVLGPYMVQQGLRGTALETLQGLEKQARLRLP